jgi:site-specific DNA recombinase
MIAAIYARKSTDQSGVSADQNSVARQIDHARAYAQRKGWTIVEDQVYVDDGISGAEFATRPGFVRLMTAVAAKPRPPFDVLVMSEESRLGRETIEVAYALKQIIQAGVAVWCYLDDRQRTLDGPMEKAMHALQTMADELERDKARQRVMDAMGRKARAGFVTGGDCFGYCNREVRGGDGKRSHVIREVVDEQAAVVRTVFQWAADGLGKAAIAKRLNREGALAPRPRSGRPSGWTPSTVGAVLQRPIYRGQSVYGRRQTRDTWGQRRIMQRPASAWITVETPALRIVSEELWTAAQQRLETARATYLTHTGGRLWGRSPGIESKYLLTGHVACPACGGPMQIEWRKYGARRMHVLTCSVYQRRGPTVCAYKTMVPMRQAEEAILDVVARELLRPERLEAVLDRAIATWQTGHLDRNARRLQLEQRAATLTREMANLTDALAQGAAVTSIAEALATREAERRRVQEDLATATAEATWRPADWARFGEALATVLEQWRGELRADPITARPLLGKLLPQRVQIAAHVVDGHEGFRIEGTGSVEAVLPDEVRKLVPVPGCHPRSATGVPQQQAQFPPPLTFGPHTVPW